MKEDILVSICCITYNQENYIRDALDSFISQETNFKYEILIHDDNSSDKTRDIIKEYELKYPKLIKPIYQSENQYSKGKKITAEYNFPRVNGKYIALCEGDDYWIDNKKLQKPVDLLDKIEDYSLVVHPSVYFDQQTNIKNKKNFLNKDTILNIEDFLDEYYNVMPSTLFHTSSLLFRNRDIKKLLNEKIDFYFKCKVGDIPLELYLANQGKIYFINEYMSVYRQNATGSWSLQQQDKNRYLNSLQNIKEMYNSFNLYTKNRYRDKVNKFINYIDFYINLNNENYKNIIENNNQDLFKTLDLKSRIYIFLQAYFPQVMQIRKILKEK